MTNPILEKMKKSLESDVAFHTTYDGDFVEEIMQLIEQQENEIKTLKESRNHWAGMCRHFTIRSNRFEEALKQLNEYTMLESMQDIIDEALKED